MTDKKTQLPSTLDATDLSTLRLLHERGAAAQARLEAAQAQLEAVQAQQQLALHQMQAKYGLTPADRVELRDGSIVRAET